MAGTSWMAERNFGSDVAAGRIGGYQSRMKFGSVTTSGTSEQLVHEGSGLTRATYLGWLTVAQTVSIAAGGSIADTAGGTGAHSITIAGLDENWDEVGEEVILAGALASASTTTKFIRVFRGYVTECGSGMANAGDISIVEDGALGELAVIPAMSSQTQMMIMTIPNGCQFIGDTFEVSIDSGKAATFRVYARSFADDLVRLRPWRLIYTAAGIDGGVQSSIVMKGGLRFFPRTDLYVSVESDQGGAVAHATISGHTRPYAP